MGKKIRRRLIAGNWKMNGDILSLEEIRKMVKLDFSDDCDVAICPPATLLMEATRITSKSKIIIGAQDCHHIDKGAYTGEISAKMLSDVGVRAVIIGHSERRSQNHETNQLIKKKVEAAHNANILAIVCIGESEDQRHAGLTESVVLGQLADSIPRTTTHLNTVIAYEPVWAIGTGKTPSLDEIARVHKTLRSFINKDKGEEIALNIRLLYGGSVKPENSKDIFNISDVDGALVGGASLTFKDFSSIINS